MSGKGLEIPIKTHIKPEEKNMVGNQIFAALQKLFTVSIFMY